MKKTITEISSLRRLRTGVLAIVLGLTALGSWNAPAQTISLAWSNLWKLPAHQEYDFLLTNAAGAALNNVRGACLNPANGNVIYASRDGGSNHLAVVDGATGVVLTRLSGVGITGGGLALSQVRATSEGVIYAANVAAPTAGGASALKIYRWSSDATTDNPAVVFNLLVPSLTDGGTRYGDAMDLRGSGVDTEIIMTGIGGTNFAYFTTTDGTNFNALPNELDVLTNYIHEILFPAGFSAGAMGRALTFEGDNNAVYGKDNTSTTRYVTFDPVSGTSTNGGSFITETRLAGFDYAVTNGLKALAGVAYGSGATLAADQHQARLFDITATNAAQIVASEPMPAPYIANANAIGATDIQGDKIVILEPGGGLSLFRLFVVTNPPPGVTIQPVGNTNILTGGFYNLSVSASGSGLKYQWYLGSAPVANGTNALLALTNLISAAAGDYSVIITNTGGAITSSVAKIGLLPSTLTSVAAKLWQLPPGSRSYLNTDGTQRGLAFNSASNRLYVVSRTGGNNIRILNPDTGADLGALDLTGVGGQTGETLPINMIGVADDGAIYVCNLANTTSGGAFTIYRWNDDAPTTLATIAYGPDNPGVGRIGDAFAVTGSGVNTRLIASSRSGTQVIVFTTFDGFTFFPNTVDVTEAPTGFAGLGLTAGGPDKFWATSSGGFALREVFYDLTNGTNTVLRSMGGQSGYNIGADAQNDFVASIGTVDTPSNMRLLNVYNQTTFAPLVDQEFFGTDNENGNGTGAIAFDVAGGRIFGLDSNNGLIAVKYAPRLKQNGTTLTWTGPGTLQAAGTVTGTYTNVTGAVSPYVSPAVDAAFYRVTR